MPFGALLLPYLMINHNEFLLMDFLILLGGGAKIGEGGGGTTGCLNDRVPEQAAAGVCVHSCQWG